MSSEDLACLLDPVGEFGCRLSGVTPEAQIFVISAHEDLNAIRYYRRMKREDRLLGTLHRPWSDMMLTNQLDVYLRIGLVQVTFTGEGEMLELTDR